MNEPIFVQNKYGEIELFSDIDVSDVPKNVNPEYFGEIQKCIDNGEMYSLSNIAFEVAKRNSGNFGELLKIITWLEMFDPDLRREISEMQQLIA